MISGFFQQNLMKRRSLETSGTVAEAIIGGRAIEISISRKLMFEAIEISRVVSLKKCKNEMFLTH